MLFPAVLNALERVIYCETKKIGKLSRLSIFQLQLKRSRPGKKINATESCNSLISMCSKPGRASRVSLKRRYVMRHLKTRMVNTVMSVNQSFHFDRRYIRLIFKVI